MFVDPEQVINSIGMEHGMQVADFGSGSGAYSIPAAKAVGPSGKVYALDVQKEMLELVRSRARKERILNIATMWADLEIPGGSQLAAGAMDIIIVSNILFQTKNKKTMLEEAFRVLKSGGKIAVIDWSSSPKGAGPRADMIVPKDETEKLLENAGFRREKEFNAGESHYGLLYAKR